MGMAKRQDPKRAEQARKCYELALLGYSQRQIAEKIGVSQTTVHNRIEEQIAKRLHPKADEYRAQQIDRLTMYLRSLAPHILAGDAKAIANALRVEERIAKLYGLDSATQYVVKAEVSHEDSLAMQLLDKLQRDREAEDAERAAAGLPPLPRSPLQRHRAKQLEAGIEPPRPASSAAETNEHLFAPDYTPPVPETATDFEDATAPEPAPRPRRRNRNIEVTPE